MAAVALVVAVTNRGAANPPQATAPRPDHASSPRLIVPSPASVGLWHHATITSPGDDRTQPAHVLSYADGEMRVRAEPGDTEPNRREVWVLHDDDADSDTTVRIGAPSSLGGAFNPQPGIALRVSTAADGSGRALVIDGNVWADNFARMIIGVWSWPADGSQVKIDIVTDQLVLDERVAPIIATLRNAGNPADDVFVVSPSTDLRGPDALHAGDHVDITSSLDGRYSQTNATVTAVSADRGWITVSHPGASDAIPLEAAVGTIRLHASGNIRDPRSLYPRYLRVRITGSRLEVKTWLTGTPQPDWQFIGTVPKRFDLPTRGSIGLISNHLFGAGQYLAFGDVAITPIHTG
ncbi:MAG: hypothetical protein JST73_02130 [Actinobacteria bacterium]|nr:hypothetical protein [Actinomycetota bacterium]